MKRLSILFIHLIVYLLQCFSISVYAQHFSLKPFFRSLIYNQNVYKTKSELTLFKVYDLKRKMPLNDTNSVFKIKVDSGNFLRYSVVQEKDKPVIRILKGTTFENVSWSPAGTKSVTTIEFSKNGEPSNGPNSYYFQFEEKDVSSDKKYLATEHITGIPVTIPVKYRFSTPANRQAFSLNPSIGYSFGYRIKLGNNPYRENYMRYLVAVGLGTDTYLAADSINVKDYKGEPDISFSYGVGVMLEIANRFNVGILYGKDRMFGDKKDWFYQNKPWCGLGFGYKFKTD